MNHKHFKGSLSAAAEGIYGKRSKILALAARHDTPFYLIDEPALKKSARDFMSGFRKHFGKVRFFYAIKANYHPQILKLLVRSGMSLDASSGRELHLALAAGAKNILFSGPGKTKDELAFALKHRDKVIVNIDSFGELETLGKLSARLKGKPLQVGVRFFSSVHESWSKFGIPLSDLKMFWQRVQVFPGLQLSGLHFHTSLNLNAERYVAVIRELGDYLQKYFSGDMLSEIKFLDIGGGFFPHAMEGYYPHSRHYHWMPGKNKTDYSSKYITHALTPAEYAASIRSAMHKYLPFLDAEVFVEPGRVVVTPGMHLVLRVADVKKDLAITDGGMNMMGWEFGQSFYIPLVNLTNYAKKEMRYTLYGSLCTPRDVWGYNVFAKKIAVGDIIVIPNQGAYRFALAQSFIKPIPPVLRLV